jgi:hypothetical protein
MTSRTPKSTTARDHPPLPGRGLNAAATPSPPAAAARDAVSPAPDNGIPGTLKPASGAAHPVAPLAASPAPGSPPVPGAEGGHGEPPSTAPARAPAAVFGCGARGVPVSRVGRERDAGPGVAAPGPALASPLAAEGRAGGDGKAAPAVPSTAGAAKTSVPGGRPGLPGTELSPAGGGPDSSSAPLAGATPEVAGRLRPAAAASGPEPKSGQAGREAGRAAWRKALSDQAAEKRRARGKWTPRSTAGAYRPGMTRRAPE